MITGSNTNVRYRGKIFHVQTEDSGRKNPHIISHVYFGGTILASEKREYADLLDSTQDLETDVKTLIEDQHQKMLQRLKSGELDEVIAERLGADTQSTKVAGKDAAEASESPSVAGNGDLPDTSPQFSSGAEEVPPAAEAKAEPESRARAFGDGIVSQKPLDEVILDYLVDKARQRSGGKRDSRKKG